MVDKIMVNHIALDGSSVSYTFKSIFSVCIK